MSEYSIIYVNVWYGVATWRAQAVQSVEVAAVVVGLYLSVHQAEELHCPIPDDAQTPKHKNSLTG